MTRPDVIERRHLLDRRHLLGGAAALAVATTAATTAGRVAAGRPASSIGAETTVVAGGTLAVRGVNYDVGSGFDPAWTSPLEWNPEYVAADMRAIADELGGNAVLIVGSDVQRLTDACAAASAAGLSIWLEPRPFDLTTGDAIEYFVEIATAAAELRQSAGDIVLSLGTEHTIFVDGIVPGSSWDERGANLSTVDWDQLAVDLNEFLGRAVAAVREVFDGDVTYSAGYWEPIEWAPFDLVGVNLYRDSENKATYVDDVRALLDHGKPVVITEFGCCSFVGADELGGTGFTIVDYTRPMPVIPAGTVRDEGVQARYLDELLTIFEDEGLHGAFVWTFIEPDTFYETDPRFDFDMAGFAIVRCTDGPDGYNATGNWTPKESFAVVADHFGGPGHR